ncbi:MAG: hypothetical protein J1F64_07315 [Oscillospiraceae bacterium]|nr:hypothetical protein [Oscillospiraceae bacterium]
MKVGELGYALNENYSSNQKLRLVFDMENAFSETPQISNLQAELVSSTAKDKEIIESNNTLSISSFNLIEPGKSFDLKDVTFNIILKGKKLYISTNLVEVMKSVKPDDKTLAIAAEIINENTWLEGDIDELLVDFCGMDEKSAELFTAMLTEPQSFDKALSASFAGFDENSAISAVMMESQIDSIIRLFGDDLFKLNQNADGSYNFSYSLTKDKLIDYITEAAAASGEIGIEDMLEAEEIFEAFNINITINGNISDEKINNDMSLEISVNTDAFKLNAAWAAQSDSEIGTVDFTDYAFPENTRNLNTILTLLKTRLY